MSKNSPVRLISYAYPSEKFSAARRRLMLPHREGEDMAIADAFHECSLGLRDICREDLDETAEPWFDSLQEFMSTTGLQDPSKIGLWRIKAQSLTLDQRFAVARIIDELAEWFKSR